MIELDDKAAFDEVGGTVVGGGTPYRNELLELFEAVEVWIGRLTMLEDTLVTVEVFDCVPEAEEEAVDVTGGGEIKVVPEDKV